MQYLSCYAYFFGYTRAVSVIEPKLVSLMATPILSTAYLDSEISQSSSRKQRFVNSISTRFVRGRARACGLSGRSSRIIYTKNIVKWVNN